MDRGTERQHQGHDGNPGIGPMGERIAGQVESRDDKQAHHRWGGPQAKAPQPRVLHKPLELLGGSGGQDPWHEKDPQCRGYCPYETRRPVADKRGGDEHGAWCHVTKGHGSSKVLRADPAGLAHGEALDQWQGGLAAPKGEQAHEHKAPENVQDHAPPSFARCAGAGAIANSKIPSTPAATTMSAALKPSHSPTTHAATAIPNVDGSLILALPSR